MSTLPCMSETDACRHPKPCRYKRDLDNGLRQRAWVTERCEELKARAEGFKTVEELTDGIPETEQ